MTPAASPGATVDIVVPVYNAPDDVRDCVASVLAHTRPPFRLVLIDDASRDPGVGESCSPRTPPLPTRASNCSPTP